LVFEIGECLRTLKVQKHSYSKNNQRASVFHDLPYLLL